MILATHPLDLIKVRLQVNKAAAGDAAAPKEGIFRTGARVFRTEGIAGLYNGYASATIAWVVSCSHSVFPSQAHSITAAASHIYKCSFWIVSDHQGPPGRSER